MSLLLSGLLFAVPATGSSCPSCVFALCAAATGEASAAASVPVETTADGTAPADEVHREQAPCHAAAMSQTGSESAAMPPAQTARTGAQPCQVDNLSCDGVLAPKAREASLHPGVAWPSVLGSEAGSTPIATLPAQVADRHPRGAPPDLLAASPPLYTLHSVLIL